MKFLLSMMVVASSAISAFAEDKPRQLWQPVMEYMVREPTKIPGRKAVGVLKVNPFITYSHIGTDFGFHGPGERFITWDQGSIVLSLENQTDWAGMWHSLAGLAVADQETMDFQGCYPDLIAASYQPTVNALRVRAAGKGKLKFEIKGPGPQQSLHWTRVVDVDSADPLTITLDLNPAEIRAAKFLVWTAEPGASLALMSLQLGVQMPAMSYERYVMLASLAKLARCYTPGHGLVTDRAHIPAGSFDSLPASGLFALAVAAASTADAGLIAPERARAILHDVVAGVFAVPRAKGLLPHFARMENGSFAIHKGTEYSTVDTSLCYHGLLMAAEVLGDFEVKTRVLGAIREIDFKSLLLPNNTISHGLKDDGQTLLEHGWDDWGGETALVLLTRRLGSSEHVPQVMSSSGHPWQGTGFISEIQSLFYPDFDSPIPDAISRIAWPNARREMLRRQKEYFPREFPDSRAVQMGLYGLSAGEGAYGTTYDVNGVDLSGQKLIHPHYILMSATLEEDPATPYRLLRSMEDAGWFSPWGLVENFTADGSRYLPMIGSLNAAFETLGAYHLMAKSLKHENAIYKASHDMPEMRDAIKIFYPGAVARR